MSSASQHETATIAVMGATGSGKTSFINLASGSDLAVGYGLESCTGEVEAATPFILNNKTVTLIDTPGFDDTTRSEAEILGLISHFLAATYENGRKLNGVVYLHRISDYRMGGVARRNFRLFRELCGEDALKNVVIVTNMWGDVTLQVGEAREAELARSDHFYRAILDKGAHMLRHDNTLESARAIISAAMGLIPEALLVQHEMVDEELYVSETSAGQELQADLDKQAKVYRDNISAIKQEMVEILAKRDAARNQELQSLRIDLIRARQNLERVEKESRKLQDDLTEHQKLLAKRMREAAEVIEDKETSLRKLQKQNSTQQAQIEELKMKVAETQQDSNASIRAVLDQYREELEVARVEEGRKTQAMLQTASEAHAVEIQLLHQKLADQTKANETKVQTIHKAHQEALSRQAAQFQRRIAGTSLPGYTAAPTPAGQQQDTRKSRILHLIVVGGQERIRLSPEDWQSLGYAVNAL
ncbi:hypothetical protein QCA50_014451 [Cerrena zonata]|uniref:G domain-containing protein n=1 Tax=Cerrena zonata TaxID=2478898 RepID=A0AAW0FZ80_9APHY